MFEYTNLADLKAQYRKLAAIMHPDGGGTSDDFVALQDAYASCVAAINANTPWVHGEYVKHKSFVLQYHDASPSADYTTYVGTQSAITTINEDCADLIDHGITMLAHCNVNGGTDITTRDLSFPVSHRIAERSTVTQFNIDRELLSLDTVLRQYNIPLAHALWMIGRIIDVLCAFNMATVAHNGYLPQNVYFDLKSHTIAVIGGWIYAMPYGKNLVIVPAAAHKHMLVGAHTSKFASDRIDRRTAFDMVLQIMKCDQMSLLRGDIISPYMGTVLLSLLDKKVGIVDLYREWVKARDAFTPRKWVDFDFSANKK